MTRLQRLKSLPCVQCHTPPPSDPCHANWGEFGKGMGLKADDDYTIPLCRACHRELDTYQFKSREVSKEWFLKKLEFVNSVLNEQNNQAENLF